MLGISVSPFHKIGMNRAALDPSGGAPPPPAESAIFLEDGYSYIVLGEHADFTTPIKFGSSTRGKAIGRSIAMN